MKHIKELIKSKPFLTIRKLNKAVIGKENSTLSSWLGGHAALPEKHIWNLCKELCNYGLIIKGHRFTYDGDIGAFKVESENTEKLKLITHKSESGTYIEHLASLNRSLLNDKHELINFLKMLL